MDIHFALCSVRVLAGHAGDEHFAYRLLLKSKVHCISNCLVACISKVMTSELFLSAFMLSLEQLFNSENEHII